jgi:ubiquinone/menaquinone biosynthesis C-methylase UbiE
MRLRLAAVVLVAFALAAPQASAQLAGRTAQEWLSMLASPSRIQGLKVPETVAALNLKPGDVVVDVGAGAGVFEAELAAAVGPAGKVYAVEVDKALVDAIAAKLPAFGLTNVVPVLGQFTDPALPAADVDLAFIHDVLHHIEDRPTYLKALSRYIKPAGRIALVDFYPGRAHLDQPGLLIPKAQATALMADAGFYPVAEHVLSEEKYFVIYARR